MFLRSGDRRLDFEVRTMSSKRNQPNDRIYDQHEFKSFDHFIDFASEMMITRAEVERIICQPTERILPFLRTIEKKILIEAFFNFDEESILKLVHIFPKDEQSELKKVWAMAGKPSTENQWAAQKTIVVLFQRYCPKQIE